MTISKYKKEQLDMAKHKDAGAPVYFKIPWNKFYLIPLVMKIGINIFAILFLKKNFTY